MKKPFGIKTALLSLSVIVVSFTLISGQLFAQAQQGANQGASSSDDSSGIKFEKFRYFERIYRNSTKTVVGEETELEVILRKDLQDWGYFNLGIEIDPQSRALDFNTDKESKTSRFTLQFGNTIDQCEYQIDLDLNTNEGDNGGMSIGLDQDSASTYLRHNSVAWLDFTLFPYNFGASVGEEFDTGDVTRFYYIDGSPDAISNEPVGSERLSEKTIPGAEIRFKTLENSLIIGFAYGAASYLYPADASYDIENQAPVDRWHWKQNRGMKISVLYDTEIAKIDARHVEQSESNETGALLKSATGITAKVDGKIAFVNLEYVSTKAGKNPYNVDKDSRWFADQNPYNPVYSDYYENRQDWINKRDSAWMLQAGAPIGNLKPYVSYKKLGEFFVYEGSESAHVLRTNDRSQSHGGMNITSIGLMINSDNLSIIPEVSYLKAENKVFDNSSDVRRQEFLADYKKEDAIVSMTIDYKL